MGQVKLTLNGRTYRIGCGEGEEQRLQSLGEHVSAKIDTVVREFGQVGEQRVFMLAALLIADELFEARAERDMAASTAAAAALREIAERTRPSAKGSTPPPLPPGDQSAAAVEIAQPDPAERPAAAAPAARKAITA